MCHAGVPNIVPDRAALRQMMLAVRDTLPAILAAGPLTPEPRRTDFQTLAAAREKILQVRRLAFAMTHMGDLVALIDFAFDMASAGNALLRSNAQMLMLSALSKLQRQFKWNGWL